MSRVWIIAGAFALLVACNALNGVADLEVAAGAVDGGAAGDGGPGAAPDGAGPDDGGDVLLPSCGVSSVCVPAGAGWTPVASPRNATSSCPTAYPTATDLFSSNTFDSCSCTCTPSSPVACPAKATIAYGSFKCETGSANVDLAADGGCTPFNVPGSAPYVAFQGGAPPAGSNGTWTCDAKAAPSFSPPPPVRVCAGGSTSPTGCASDSLCVPAAPGNSRNCVIHDGDVPCPQGLNRRSVVGADPQDGRACSSCACAPDNCADGKLTGWLSSTCFGPQPLPKGTCTFNGVQALSYVPSNGCAVTTQAQVTGSVTLSGVRTLCCQ